MDAYSDSLQADAATHADVMVGLEEMRGWLRSQADTPPDGLSRTLAVQEAWLFKGIALEYGPPPPYETLHRRPGAAGEAETLVSLQAFYREAGAELSPASRERVDHLGVQLDFMRFLCGEESRLWQVHDVGEACRYRQIQRRLVDEHLMPWVPGYCQRIRAEARAPFFHGVAKMLAGFLAEDARLLGDEDA
jgi:TorA maturation chaperone TorD